MYKVIDCILILVDLFGGYVFDWWFIGKNSVDIIVVDYDYNCFYVSFLDLGQYLCGLVWWFKFGKFGFVDSNCFDFDFRLFGQCEFEVVGYVLCYLVFDNKNQVCVWIFFQFFKFWWCVCGVCCLGMGCLFCFGFVVIFIVKQVF